MRDRFRSERVPCRFLPWSEARRARPAPGVVRIDVSSYADDPYDTLSPYYPHGDIPVPGLPGHASETVEGIWQGLKVIRGRIEIRYFRGVGRKRGGKPAGHRYGDRPRLLGLEAARRQIYIPAYEWMLEHKVDAAMIDELLDIMRRGTPLLLHDRESNSSLAKDQPLAHASVLARWLNRQP